VILIHLMLLVKLYKSRATPWRKEASRPVDFLIKKAYKVPYL
jgi:hypothetical protein